MHSPAYEREANRVVLLLALSSVGAALTIGHRLAVGASRIEFFALAVAVPVLAGMGLSLHKQPRLLKPVTGLLAVLGASYLVVRAAAAVWLNDDPEHLRIGLTHVSNFAPLVYLIAVMGLSQARSRLLIWPVFLALIGISFAGLLGPLGRQIDPMARFALSEGFVITPALLLVFLSVFTSARARAREADRAWGEARTDSLTGVANRRALEEEVLRDLDRGVQGEPSIAIILLDVDRFKRVNDQFGHAVGDDVLVRIAQILEREVRTGDVVGRWGGEEFVILLRRTDRANAQVLAERLRGTIADSLFPGVGRMTVSMGVSAARSDDDVTDLLRRADRALYEAKTHGRNRSVLARLSVPGA